MDDDRSRGYQPINGRGWNGSGCAWGIDHTVKCEAIDVRESELNDMPEQEALLDDNDIDFNIEKRVEFAPVEYVDRTCARYDMIAADETDKLTQRVSNVESSVGAAHQEQANSIAAMQDVIANFVSSMEAAHQEQANCIAAMQDEIYEFVSKYEEDLEKQSRMNKKYADIILVVVGIILGAVLTILCLAIRME